MTRSVASARGRQSIGVAPMSSLPPRHALSATASFSGLRSSGSTRGRVGFYVLSRPSAGDCNSLLRNRAGRPRMSESGHELPFDATRNQVRNPRRTAPAISCLGASRTPTNTAPGSSAPTRRPRNLHKIRLSVLQWLVLELTDGRSRGDRYQRRTKVHMTRSAAGNSQRQIRSIRRASSARPRVTSTAVSVDSTSEPNTSMVEPRISSSISVK